MSSWVAVSRQEHATIHWRPRSGFEFAAAQQAVPIIMAELSKLLPHYVLGFVKTDNDSFQAVALVGLGGERNVYTTSDSKWMCSYVPATLRAYPFAQFNSPEGDSILCIDDAFLTTDTVHPRLFGNDGELEQRATEMRDLVAQCEQNRQLTVQACSALAEAQVIEHWPISISRGNGKEPLKIEGMYRINEKELNSIDADTLAFLRNSGALPLAYAQLFSIGQTSQLTQRAEYLAKQNEQASPASDLSNLFSSENTGSLNFDAFDTRNEDTEDK